MDKLSEEIGYIYCLSNESYKDTYKIGFTKNDPLTRMVQLNTTGLLYPFKLEFAKQVKNHQDKEKKLHLIFDKYRVNKNREFFKIELKEIKQLFDLIDGEWYKLNSPNKEPTKLNSPNKEPTKLNIPNKEPTKLNSPNKEPTKLNIPNKEPTKLNIPNKEPTKSIGKLSNISPSSEKTSLTGFKHSTYSSTYGNTNVKTLVKNVEHTFCILLKEPTKSICKASNTSPSSEKTSLTGFKNSTNVEHTYCSRCSDKLNIQQGIIKCKHLDMCNECCNVIKKCPICKVSYNT